MAQVLQSIRRALLSVFIPQIFLRLLLPGILAFSFWILMYLLNWSQWAMTLTDAIAPTGLISAIVNLLSGIWLIQNAVLAEFLAIFILICLFLPLIYITSMALASFILVPILSGLIHKKHFVLLEKANSSYSAKGIWISLKATAIYAILLIVFSPLLLIPGMQIVLPMLLNGYLAKNILAYDILQGIATEQEVEFILHNKRFELQTMGFLTSIFFFLPVINFIAPAIVTIAFIYYLFEALLDHRTQSRSR
jgi:hypothetical protein